MRRVALILLLPSSALFAQAYRYIVDPAHTSIIFNVRHMMVTTVRGSFGKFEGWIEYDPKNPQNTKAEGIVYVSSIDTKNDRRDKHLLSEDFFDAEKYPTMKMVLKKVYKKGNRWWADADLTIKDVTKTVSFPFKIYGPVKDNWGNLRIGVEASFEINRFDFGLNWNQVLETGGLVVDKTVKVELNIEAIYKPTN